MLEPLKQWICDSCGKIINLEESGWVEWLQEDALSGQRYPSYLDYGFKIVHAKEECSFYSRKHGPSSLSLESFIGDRGYALLLSFLDLGPYANTVYEGPRVKDMREFVHFMKRLILPYYEEASLYFEKAINDDELFLELNEGVSYPEYLKKVIQKYVKD